jgi:hypothetical protein
VIGLPDLIGAFGLAAMDKVVGRAIGFFAINGEGLQILGDGANDVVDSVVARRIAALVTCDAADLPIDGSWTKGGPLQRQAFGEVAQIIRQTTAFPVIGPSGPGQASQPKSPVPANPILSGSQRE